MALLLGVYTWVVYSITISASLFLDMYPMALFVDFIPGSFAAEKTNISRNKCFTGKALSRGCLLSTHGY